MTIINGGGRRIRNIRIVDEDDEQFSRAFSACRGLVSPEVPLLVGDGDDDEQ